MCITGGGTGWREACGQWGQCGGEGGAASSRLGAAAAHREQIQRVEPVRLQRCFAAARAVQRGPAPNHEAAHERRQLDTHLRGRFRGRSNLSGRPAGWQRRRRLSSTRARTIRESSAHITRACARATRTTRTTRTTRAGALPAAPP